MKYGGIYLDNDVYVVQNLNKYRKFELVIGWDEGQFLGSQVRSILKSCFYYSILIYFYFFLL